MQNSQDPVQNVQLPLPVGASSEDVSTRGAEGMSPGTEVSEPTVEERMDPETLETALKALLSLYPEAPVSAASADGLYARVPASIDLGLNPVLEDRPSLDLVIPQDRLTLIDTWDRALARGGARCLFHLIGPPVRAVAYHVFDLREPHGVILAVLVPVEEADAPIVIDRDTLKAVPRFARLRKDERGFIVGIDEAITQILGWSAEEMTGRRTTDFLHPDDHALAIENWMEMLASPGLGRRVRLRHRRRGDEAWVWFEVTNQNLLDDPAHRCVVSEMVDISEEMAAHEALRAREQLLDRLAEAIPLGLFQIDASRRIVYTNARLHDILGVEAAGAVEAQLATVTEDDWPALERALDSVLEDGLPADIEIKLRLPGSEELRFCSINLRALSHDDGTISGAIASVADVTDGSRMRDELKRRATFDELTGCYNRASIMRALEANIADADADADGHGERAVMFLDLDRFKQINDRLGHAAGDELLSVVAARLRSAVRAGDMVGRFGGDEFLVLCPEIGGPEQAMKLAERLSETLRRDVRLASGNIAHQVSIGVGWSDGDVTDADVLVAEADGAMYESKRERTGQPKLARSGRAVGVGGSA
jgi:diguanylate cyclase (GGDEF)-like protein/PAS domain S-box-containing protein